MAKKKGKKQQVPAQKTPAPSMGGDVLPYDAVPQPGHPSTKIMANDATTITDPSSPDNKYQLGI